MIKKKVGQKKRISKTSIDPNSHLEENLLQSIKALIIKTVEEFAGDIQRQVLEALKNELSLATTEKEKTILEGNLELARSGKTPVGQDTGIPYFFIYYPFYWGDEMLREKINKAVYELTLEGVLRQNSLDPFNHDLTSLNLGPGHPVIHFFPNETDELKIGLLLKTGKDERASFQHILPDFELDIKDNLVGARKIIEQKINLASENLLGPYVLGVAIGGGREIGFQLAHEGLLRAMDDQNPHQELNILEQEIQTTFNALKVGPVGVQGKTHLLGCKISSLNCFSNCFLVTVVCMGWALRRQMVSLNLNGKIVSWENRPGLLLRK